MITLPYRPLPIDGIHIMTSMTEAETARLREVATDRTMLEIGSAHGWSTCNIAQVAKSVVAVDVHDESAPHAAPNSFDVLEGNLIALGLFEKVDIKVGLSRQRLPELRHESTTFTGAFVDGDHSLEGCTYDMWMAWRMLRRGGSWPSTTTTRTGTAPR